MTNYESLYAIDCLVEFDPFYEHTISNGDNPNVNYGRIVSIKFTKAKIFYTIVDDYYGDLYKDLPSDYVLREFKYSKQEGTDE